MNINRERLDLDMLNQHFAGDEDFKVFYLNLAVSQLEQAFDEITIRILDNNYTGIESFLHKLKGSSASVGLIKLSQFIILAEKQFNTKPGSALALFKVEEELKLGLKELKTILNSSTNENFNR